MTEHHKKSFDWDKASTIARTIWDIVWTVFLLVLIVTIILARFHI